MKLVFTCVTALLAIYIGASSAAAVAQERSLAIDSEGSQNDARVFVTSDRESPYVQFAVSVRPAEAKDTVTVEVETSIAKDWHIGPTVVSDSEFGLPTTIEFESEDWIELDKEFTPSVAPTNGNFSDDTQEFHSGTFKWTRNYKSMKPIDKSVANVSIRFQVCNNTKCLPPKTVSFALKPSSDRSDPEESSDAVKINHEKIGKPIEVSLEKCNLKRKKVKLGEVSVVSLMFSGIGNDSLNLTGKISVESESFNFYLPKVDELSLVNTGAGRTRFENTADYMSIDHNGDGKFGDWEAVAMDGPIRIADSMFRVTSFDRQSKKITFQQIDAPIEGSIVGRKCPPFSYTSTEGDTISDKSILGKVTILDIWAVT